MKDRTSKPDRSNMTNLRPATCEHCGADLKPGAGFVWICLGPKGECEDPVHIERGGGAHIRCKDQGACHGRATKAAGGRSKRAALAAVAAVHRENAPETPQIATETHEAPEAGPPDAENGPGAFQGPLQRSEVEAVLARAHEVRRPGPILLDPRLYDKVAALEVEGIETESTFEFSSGTIDEEPPRRVVLVTTKSDDHVETGSVIVAGPPNGTYVGAPLRRDCPRGHAGTVMSAGLVREFTLVGVDWYVCDGCGEGIWVWRCCGHVALEAPAQSPIYRDPAFTNCPACGENRFEARREPLKEKTWTS